MNKDQVRDPRGYPFLRPVANPPENVPGEYLSCWAHCLRDSLEAAGVTSVAARLARPLNFRIEWESATGLVPYTCYGGLDTDDPPRPHGGVALTLHQVVDIDQAFEIVLNELAAGRTILSRLDVQHLPASRWFRVGFDGYRNTNMIIGRERNGFLLADRHVSRASGWTDYRGLVDEGTFRSCLNGAELVTWTVDEQATPFTPADFNEFVQESIRLMSDEEVGCGLRGILDLGDTLLRLRSNVARQSHLQFRLSTPMMALVGDRLFAARALTQSGEAELAVQLERCADKWHRVAFMIYLCSRSHETTVPVQLLDQIEKLHEAEAGVIQSLRTLARNQPMTGK